jgi:hypothetical protein
MRQLAGYRPAKVDLPQPGGPTRTIAGAVDRDHFAVAQEPIEDRGGKVYRSDKLPS